MDLESLDKKLTHRLTVLLVNMKVSFGEEKVGLAGPGRMLVVAGRDGDWELQRGWVTGKGDCVTVT